MRDSVKGCCCGVLQAVRLTCGRAEVRQIKRKPGRSQRLVLAPPLFREQLPRCSCAPPPPGHNCSPPLLLNRARPELAMDVTASSKPRPLASQHELERSRPHAAQLLVAAPLPVCAAASHTAAPSVEVARAGAGAAGKGEKWRERPAASEISARGGELGCGPCVRITGVSDP